jgi:tetratricopeptide (TPR) repeat protein
MKKASYYELWDSFLKLEKLYKDDVGFYFEMADFFFKNKMADKAQELLYNAIELCNGSTDGLILAAYMYENWKWFDKAIAVYKGILSQDANYLMVKRDLALAYFQHKDFEAAVKTYYSIITTPDENDYYAVVKENALAEMNAVLAMHKNKFDISYINHNLVKTLPVDLRITVETNYNRSSYLQITGPGDKKPNGSNSNTANKSRLINNNYSWGHHSLSEYAVKDAPTGAYRIKVHAYNDYTYPSRAPMYMRVIAFKNFQKENMELEISLFDLDNQYGIVELDEVRW